MSSPMSDGVDGVSTTAPIFVVGFPRSGTTLLQAIIGSHPRIASPPEMHFLRRVAGFADHWGDLADDEVLRRVIDETLGWPAVRRNEVDFDLGRIFARAAPGPRTYGSVLHAVMREFADHYGKQRWCEKTPLQGADLIWQHFPDAQIVHIVRDPRDTIASATDKLGIWKDPATAARRWLVFTVATMRCGNERGSRHYLRVRYEDLTADPPAVLAPIFSFLGETFDPDIVSDVGARRSSVFTGGDAWQGRVLEPVAKADAGARQQHLRRRDRVRVAAIVEPIVLGLGYQSATRGTVIGGSLLNGLVYPADWLTERRQRARLARARSPQERYEASKKQSVRLLQTMQKTVDQAKNGAGAGKS
jgi:hypothetical protein